MTFRHPSLLANAVATVDHISGGRVELGMGAGWMEQEHEAYGFPFPALRERLARLAEQLEIVHRLWTEERVDFAGTHYTLTDCPALPKPVQQPHPPILVGGRAKPGTLEPAVRFADEYNLIGSSLDEYAAARKALDEACERADRDPATLGLSVMTGFALGADRDAVARAGAPDPRALGLRRDARGGDRALRGARHRRHAGRVRRRARGGSRPPASGA